jgi:hypothetical protein
VSPTSSADRRDVVAASIIVASLVLFFSRLGFAGHAGVDIAGFMELFDDPARRLTLAPVGLSAVVMRHVWESVIPVLKQIVTVGFVESVRPLQRQFWYDVHFPASTSMCSDACVLTGLCHVARECDYCEGPRVVSSHLGCGGLSRVGLDSAYVCQACSTRASVLLAPTLTARQLRDSVPPPTVPEGGEVLHQLESGHPLPARPASRRPLDYRKPANWCITHDAPISRSEYVAAYDEMRVIGKATLARQAGLDRVQVQDRLPHIPHRCCANAPRALAPGPASVLARFVWRYHYGFQPLRLFRDAAPPYNVLGYVH